METLIILITINILLLAINLAFFFYLKRQHNLKSEELRNLTTSLFNLRKKINNEGLELGDIVFLTDEEVKDLIDSLIQKEEYEIAALIKMILTKNENDTTL